MPPLYRKIASALRAEIISGVIGAGQKLPTEHQLVERFGVSRDTVRLATAQLVNEGLVVRIPGRKGGMTVRDRLMLTFHASYAEDPGAPRPESDAWHAEVRAQGLAPSQDLECRIIKLPSEIAERLGEPDGAAAVLRRCLRHVNGHPSSIQDSYYPMWLAERVEELLSPEDVPHGTTKLLADRGFVQVGFLDIVSTRMASPEEARLLEIGSGTPILIKSRTACTSTRVVRVTVEAMIGDSNAIEYEIGEISAIKG